MTIPRDGFECTMIVNNRIHTVSNDFFAVFFTCKQALKCCKLVKVTHTKQKESKESIGFQEAKIIENLGMHDAMFVNGFLIENDRVMLITSQRSIIYSSNDLTEIISI